MSSVNQVGMAGIVSLADAPGAASPGKDPTRIRAAAQQFEALLLSQILHAAHEGSSGWLGSGEDSSSACASDYAEEQLAGAMAQQGGLGLGKLIAAGLERESSFQPLEVSNSTPMPL
jgi:Rod binding domain-containing protein